MGSGLISLFIAAGVAGFAYSKLGQRIGYGNSQSVWTIVVAAFVVSFLIVFILLHTLLTINN